jgi:hypothetical protein
MRIKINSTGMRRAAHSNRAGIAAVSLWLLVIAAIAACDCEHSLAWLGLATACTVGYWTILIRSRMAGPQIDDVDAHRCRFRFHLLRYSSHGVWLGHCRCGWSSKPQRRAHLVHDEYGEHICGELGRKARYTVLARDVPRFKRKHPRIGRLGDLIVYPVSRPRRS